jgi:hypothetical protein
MILLAFVFLVGAVAGYLAYPYVQKVKAAFTSK